jgi:hypothetical protein
MTTAAELKIGQRLADSDYRYLDYGLTTECIVTSIKITKGGRYKIQYSYKYISKNGEISFGENQNYSNGAIVGHSIIELF